MYTPHQGVLWWGVFFYALTPEKQAAFEAMEKEIYPLQHIGTPEDIAKACVFLDAADVSPMTFYRHFGTKEAVIVDVILTGSIGQVIHREATSVPAL